MWYESEWVSKRKRERPVKLKGKRKMHAWG